MSLNRINTSKFDRGRGQAQRLARANLDIIVKNKMQFKITDQEYIRLVSSLHKQNGLYTDNQLSLIDSLMEKYWKLGGFDSISTKHDFTKKLRF